MTMRGSVFRIASGYGAVPEEVLEGSLMHTDNHLVPSVTQDLSAIRGRRDDI
jgi:hypothetical protein